MAYADLRGFIAMLEAAGQLRRVAEPVSPRLEMTAVCDRVLRAGGPALLFEHPTGHAMPVLGNVFGTPERVALAMGADSVRALRPFGELLARLKEPAPPGGLKEMAGLGGLLRQLWHMSPWRMRPARSACWKAPTWTWARCRCSTAGRATSRRW